MEDKKAYEVTYGRSDATYTVWAKDGNEAEAIASKMLDKDYPDQSDFYFIESIESDWAKDWDCDNYEEGEQDE